MYCAAWVDSGIFWLEIGIQRFDQRRRELNRNAFHQGQSRNSNWGVSNLVLFPLISPDKGLWPQIDGSCALGKKANKEIDVCVVIHSTIVSPQKLTCYNVLVILIRIWCQIVCSLQVLTWKISLKNRDHLRELHWELSFKIYIPVFKQRSKT